MKNKFLILTAISLSIFLTTITGCKKEKIQEDIPELQDNIADFEKPSHTWYYFTYDNFAEIDKPQNAPKKESIPWTESVRISSAGTTFSPSDDKSDSFAIVNRLGILCFTGDDIYLAADKNIFSDRTAGNLVFFNDTPVYSVYKSAFFNDTIKSPEYIEDISSHLFLIQFDNKAKISYPIINSTVLTDEPNSEVTDFVWNNKNWLCAIKTISEKKNDFSYISWNTQLPLLSLSQTNAKDNITIKESDSNTFRNAKRQLDYSEAPERIKNLLLGFSEDLPFSIEVQTAGGCSPKVYVNKNNTSGNKELIGKGILAQSWSAVLFEDGTLFIEGALPGKHILRDGNPVAIRLPKLPAGFIYSCFTISNNTLYAAWEETSFYKTGRSGFIKVDLDETLYKRLL